MKLKKNPKYSLQNKRGLFFQVGLLFALLVVNAAFEWRFSDFESKIISIEDIEKISKELEDIERIEQLERPQPANNVEEEILIKIELIPDEE